MNSSIAFCPYCSSQNLSDHQYCILCGKSMVLDTISRQKTMIANDQIFWILFGGFSTFFILKLLENKFFTFGYSVTLFIATLTSFIMISRLNILVKVYKAESIKSFFPRFVEFFFITGILIWLIATLLTIILFSDGFIEQNKLIEATIIPFTFDFIQGYTFGIVLPLFFKYYRSSKLNISEKSTS